MSTLEKAIEIAARAHAGVTDKAGAPYILHPLRVMLKVTSADSRIVAVLHDVVEDCRQGLSFEFIEQQGFDAKVLAGLRAVTKQPDEEGKHSDVGYERSVYALCPARREGFDRARGQDCRPGGQLRPVANR